MKWQSDRFALQKSDKKQSIASSQGCNAFFSYEGRALNGPITPLDYELSQQIPRTFDGCQPYELVVQQDIAGYGKRDKNNPMTYYVIAA